MIQVRTKVLINHHRQRYNLSPLLSSTHTSPSQTFFRTQTSFSFLQQLRCSSAHSSILFQLLHGRRLPSICAADSGVSSAVHSIASRKKSRQCLRWISRSGAFSPSRRAYSEVRMIVWSRKLERHRHCWRRGFLPGSAFGGMH